MTSLNGEMAESWRRKSNQFYFLSQFVNTAPYLFTADYATEIADSLRVAEKQFQFWYGLALTGR